MANRYSVFLKFLEFLNSDSMFEFEGKKIIAVTYIKLGWKGLPETNTLDYYENP